MSECTDSDGRGLTRRETAARWRWFGILAICVVVLTWFGVSAEHGAPEVLWYGPNGADPWVASSEPGGSSLSAWGVLPDYPPPEMEHVMLCPKATVTQRVLDWFRVPRARYPEYVRTNETVTIESVTWTRFTLMPQR